MKKLSALALLALLLAACGTTTESNEGSASTQATAVEALQVNEQPVQSGGEGVENQLSLDGELGLPFGFLPTDSDFLDVFSAPVSKWDCSASTVSGDATDADGDGVAVSATYNIQCTKGFANLPFFDDVVTVERSGTLVMQDADDGDPASGYRASGDFTYSYLDGTFSASHSYDRSWTRTASGYDYDHTNRWSWEAGGVSYAIEHTHGGSYTPDDTDHPFDAGWIQENATVTQYLNEEAVQSVTEEVNLHLNAACDPAADDGTVTFSWSADGLEYTKTATFTGCGEYDVQ